MNNKIFQTNILKKSSILSLIVIILASQIIMLLPNNVQASSYNQIVIEANSNNRNGIDAFPESYKILLNKLVDSTGHDNWKFKPFYTDIDWNELTSGQNENKCLRNTLYKGQDSRWYCSALNKHLENGAGTDGYYCAGSKIVNYYLDPRNFLSETTIFQFLSLGYNETANSIQNIQAALSGSFMEENANNGESYAQIIHDASVASGENALSIIVKIYQEIGKRSPGDPPSMVSGKDGTYPNTYNFFNYGATDGSGAKVRGLAYANNVGWHDPRTALVEGAKLVSSTYIKRGQDTKYTFKFDIVGCEKSDLYSHQYMTNVQDPNNQAKMLFDKYTDNEWLNNELIFVIPIYKNMPSYVKLPSNLNDGDLYYVSSNYNSVGFRSGPGTNYGRTDISRNALVRMLEKNTSGEWCKVQDENGNVGYMTLEYLTPVNTVADNYYVPGQPSKEPTNNNNGNNENDQPSNIQVTSNFKIDGDRIVTEPGTKVQNIKEKYNVISAKKGDTVLSDTDNLGTGTVITTDAGAFTIIKLGDVNGDADIDVIDLALIKRVLLSTTQLQGVYNEAGKLQGQSGEIDVVDLALLKRFLIGTQSIKI